MKRILFLLLITMLLASCSSGDKYQFKGESDHWIGEFHIKEKNGVTERKLILTYKGDIEELSSAKTLKYSYQSSVWESEIETDFGGDTPTDKTFTNVSSIDGGSEITEGDIIKVNVEWANKVEEFELLKTEE